MWENSSGNFALTGPRSCIIIPGCGVPGAGADLAFYHHVFQLAGNCEPQLFCACVSSLFKLVCGWSTAFTLTYTYSGFEKT